MDSYGELEEASEEQDRKPSENAGSLLAAKMAELGKLKDKLAKAKDVAVESWLDSRPFIDELEKLRSELTDAKGSTALFNAAISELEPQLETLTDTIRASKEEELKIRTMINRTDQVIQMTQEEMERLQMEKDQLQRARSKLKQVLRLKRQTLRTLQLTLRAIRLESEADDSSAAEANRYISLSELDDNVVKLTHEEYRALTKGAREETLLAEWRISVSVEQKQTAKERQHSAERRLKKLCSISKSKKRKHKAQGLGNQNIAQEVDELHPNVRACSNPRNGQNSLQKTQANSRSQASKRKPQEHFKKTKGKGNYLSKKTKPSCFARIRMLMVQKFKRCLR